MEAAIEFVLPCGPQVGFIQPRRVLPGGVVLKHHDATASVRGVECEEDAGLFLLGDLC